MFRGEGLPSFEGALVHAHLDRHRRSQAKSTWHAMIRTETAATRPKAKAGCGPQIDQATKAVRATTRTAGTKYADTLSAIAGYGEQFVELKTLALYTSEMGLRWEDADELNDFGIF